MMRRSLVNEIKRPQLQQVLKTDSWSRGVRKAKRILHSLAGRKYIDYSKIVPSAHPRKGGIGDWKEHFSNSDLEFFLAYAKDTMIKLNYPI